MFIKLFCIFSLVLFTGCYDQKPVKKLNGKKLLTQKCASCHDLKMPPLTTPEDIAPPIMAVAFHVLNFIKPSDESQRLQASKEFVMDYALYPSLEKSFCDEASLKIYGLMPSQKDNVTKDELVAITDYMFSHYTRENLLSAIKEKSELDSIPVGKRVAIKYGCLSCHRIDKDLVGPSFAQISKKFISSKDKLKNSITNGSKGNWENFKATMPPFKKISNDDMDKLAEWILNPDKK